MDTAGTIFFMTPESARPVRRTVGGRGFREAGFAARPPGPEVPPEPEVPQEPDPLPEEPEPEAPQPHDVPQEPEDPLWTPPEPELPPSEPGLWRDARL